MGDVSGTAALIREFVKLAMQRRKRSLSSDERSRADALDETLRQLLDGAHPAPRKIENPSAAPGARAPSGVPLGEIKVRVSKSAARPQEKSGGSDLLEELPISDDDKKKLSDVRVNALPASSYTPPRAPAFLHDYYDEDIVPAVVDPAAAPKRVIRAGGERVELTRDVRVLLGLEVTEPAGPGARAHGIGGSAGSGKPAATPPRGRPTIIHLLAGGVRRGHVEEFDPASGAVDLIEPEGTTRVLIEDVLAIFFGLQKGKEPTQVGGQKVVVKLVNDRQIVGMSEDYQEGGESLMVSPEQKRGNVDRVWIPAWAVKEIVLG